MNYKYKYITMLRLIHSSESESLQNNVPYWQNPPSQDPSLQLTGSCERPVEDGDINLLTRAATTSFRFPFHNSFCNRLPFCAAGVKQTEADFVCLDRTIFTGESNMRQVKVDAFQD